MSDAELNALRILVGVGGDLQRLAQDLGRRYTADITVHDAARLVLFGDER